MRGSLGKIRHLKYELITWKLSRHYLYILSYDKRSTSQMNEEKKYIHTHYMCVYACVCVSMHVFLNRMFFLDFIQLEDLL